MQLKFNLNISKQLRPVLFQMHVYVINIKLKINMHVSINMLFQNSGQNLTDIHHFIPCHNRDGLVHLNLDITFHQFYEKFQICTD
jgi:hypothetical protein